MSYISDYIKKKNEANEKVLSVFLTSGFPDKENFVTLALEVLDAGADSVIRWQMDRLSRLLLRRHY
jgi:tryptophan synthase alpha subunit